MHRGLIDGSKAAGLQEPSACHCTGSAIGPSTSPALAAIISDRQLHGAGTADLEIWWLYSGELISCFPQITLVSKAIKR